MENDKYLIVASFLSAEVIKEKGVEEQQKMDKIFKFIIDEVRNEVTEDDEEYEVKVLITCVKKCLQMEGLSDKEKAIALLIYSGGYLRGFDVKQYGIG